MMQSMTGYGKQILQLPSKTITIEIRTLNSKGTDIYTRIPSLYREMEIEFRKTITSVLERGKIDLSIYVEHTGGETSTKINKPVVAAYLRELASLNTNSTSDLLSIAMRLPDAVLTESQDLEEDETEELKQALLATLEEVQAFRAQEGQAMTKDFLLRLGNIQELLNQIQQVDVVRMSRLRERLLKAVSELKENVDENRFEQELIFYLERYDITEEKVRLQNHLTYFDQNLNSGESNGKKLGFICQEIGREINTIGSKANDSDMQKLVIQMKDDLEKIKEQALNVV